MLSAAAYGAYAVSATSPVFGVYKVDCPADSDTYIGISTTRTPEFSGVVEGVQTANFKIVAKGEPQWATNKFVYVASSQPNHYYLKFTSGELEGAWFDIKSNDAYSLEIEIGSAELAKVAAGDSFQIIPHWTMSTLFPDGGGFLKATKIAATAGASILYKNTAFENGVVYPTGANKAALESFSFRERGSAVGWRDAKKNDASDAVIEPNAFLKVAQPADGSSSITISGTIPMCATSFEIFTMEGESGTETQDIYLSVPSATDIALSELTTVLIDSGALVPSTGVAANPTDAIYVYGNERSGKNLAADKLVFYRKRGSVAKWMDDNRNDADSLTLKAGTAIVIRKKADTTPVAYRCIFKPNYTK